MSLKLLQDERVGALNEEQKNLLTHIRDDSQRLLNITGELLDLSQVETGNIQLNLIAVAPHELVEMSLNAVRFVAEQKQIALQINLPPTLPAIQADLDKTAWVLMNFLSNAIRHSPEKSVIEISAKIDEGKKQVEFSVKDEGKGIESKYQQRIFDRYFQVPTNGQSKTGTGLGLAISKEFIDAQNGHIGVESELGSGSRFWFQLPMA
jgi:signal transduction histidine kinase